MRLIVVGNGFDLHHGLKTTFRDYCIYLNENYPDALSCIRKYIYFNGSCRDIFDETDVFWADVENNLSFDYDKMFESSKETIDSEFINNDDSSDGWISAPKSIDDALYDIQELIPAETIENVDEVDTRFTTEALNDWVNHIYLDEVEKDPKMSLSSDDCYVSFNYTRTLEDVYRVKSSNVLHIHGGVYQGYPSDLQFGNPLQTPDAVRTIFNQKLEKDFRLERIRPDLEKIESFAHAMSKDIKGNIPNLEGFLKGKEITEVVIMGHSYLKVDKLYYQNVLVPCYHTKKWTIYCHTNYEEDEARVFLKENGIQGCTIKW